jgi:two-component sensor histidine kinase
METALQSGAEEARRCRDFGLIVTELVLNASKHAFNGREGGRVEVGCARDSSAGDLLWVADDGLGFDFGQVHATRGPGLVHRIAKAACGECACGSSQSGARVLVRFSSTKEVP